MRLKLSSVLLIVSLSLSAASTNAQSLTFDLTGNILPGVCRFTVADVDLGTYYATEFTSVGTTKNWVDFPIRSSGCDPLVTVIHMAVTGTPDATDAAYFRGVAGIGIEMQTSGSSAIRPSGTSLNYLPSAGPGNYGWRARFRQTGNIVAAGSVRSAVTIQVTYN